LLQKNDMGSNTKDNGCEKCRRKKQEAENLIKNPPPQNFDDDIPF